MAAIEAAAFSILSSSSSLPSTSPKCSLHFLKLPISTCALPFSSKRPLYPLPPLHSARKPRFQICSTSTIEEVVTVEEKTEPSEEKTESAPQTNQKRKLFVLNLPWSFTVADIKNLFAECGTVTDVEIIKQKDGKNRGFAFVTMASGEEAQAAIKKFDSHELSGRIIRVELAKRFKKPSRSPPEVPSRGETRHKLYASNLAWKVRSSHLKEFFSAYSPVSVRVVFDSPSGRSAGYGFISFATKEEAEAAMSSLEGKPSKNSIFSKLHISLSWYNPLAESGHVYR
ncbi:28 kDa ribonucleoprotein, chloroplastic isoform X2 [Coffea eugenioides]|uniref:29 kDa ribonucleoprotein A, chloroplastic-like isoform X2 n=1 Tax=Coffea arabica TaxID=13443 RepID=A0A6P6TQ03_COFAR|nr:28 kDa ribonucleoprotein, chloroplastic-like isoform X2 [Coffea arabica]XP_027080224.1 28 kDa ribonucleoprotein, chloroplastic-like isoform X2 [Coffea arabica]XP_027183251.1 28 kDa ribonucleoprotein, chloroplastic isoform X2 [Coffea eugenioides]